LATFLRPTTALVSPIRGGMTSCLSFKWDPWALLGGTTYRGPGSSMTSLPVPWYVHVQCHHRASSTPMGTRRREETPGMWLASGSGLQGRFFDNLICYWVGEQINWARCNPFTG
jgi:hypothetical protein